MTQKKQLTIMNYAAILSIFLFSGAGSFMNAAVQTMMDAWPELSATTVRLVTSLPSLLSLPITVLIGGIAAKPSFLRHFRSCIEVAWRYPTIFLLLQLDSDSRIPCSGRNWCRFCRNEKLSDHQNRTGR